MKEEEDRIDTPYVAAPDNTATTNTNHNNNNGATNHHQQQHEPVNTRQPRIKPKRLWKQFASDILTNARMHSVDVTTTPTAAAAAAAAAGPTRGATIADDEEVITSPSISSPVSCPGMTPDFNKLEKMSSLLEDTWPSLEDYYMSYSSTLEYLVPEGGSLGAAIFGIIKGTVGPAILYLPRGFQVAGWAVAIPSMIFATSMYIFNAYRLLACWKVEHDKQQHNKHHHHHHAMFLTYSQLAQRAFGPSYSKFVDIAIASLQLGVCLTYLIFVPHNLVECANTWNWNLKVWNKQFFLWGMIFVEIPLCWIRDIRKLTLTNVLATVLIAYGLASVLVLAFQQGMEYYDVGDDDYIKNSYDQQRAFVYNLSKLPVITDSWFLFVGTSFFMMEGSITLLLPLQESLLRTEDQARFPHTNQTVTTGIVVFYIAFALICCAAFGDSIHTALTASLHDGFLATTIQLAYSIAVILTFPLQAFPAMQVIKNNILEPARPQPHDNHHQPSSNMDAKQSSSCWDDFPRKALSTFIILGLGIVAMYAIDYLGNVVSILGSLFGIPLALIVPPLMHNRLVLTDNDALASNSNHKNVTATLIPPKAMNYAVITIGLMATGAASFATIMSWDKGAE